MSRREGDPTLDTSRPDPMFAGAGAGRATLRAVDWTTHTLGPVAGWPADLRRGAHTVVRAPAPMLLWWGADFVQIHNDALTAAVGHELPLASPAKECWQERWEVFAPLADQVMNSGREHGAAEVVLLAPDGTPERIWEICLGPLFDADGLPAGVLVNAADLTARVAAWDSQRSTAEATVESLERGLATNRRIGTAVGVLMAQRRITDAAAFELLREASQRTHRKLRDIAEDVLLTGALPER